MEGHTLVEGEGPKKKEVECDKYDVERKRFLNVLRYECEEHKGSNRPKDCKARKKERLISLSWICTRVHTLAASKRERKKD